MARYVLFDLDGTLTDPALGITNSIIHMLQKTGREVPPREELYCFIGPPLVPTFKKFFGMSDEEADEALLIYREYFAAKGLFENEPYKGIAEALGELRAAGKKIALATSKPEEFAKEILVHFGLFEYFDFVGGASMDEKRVAKADVIGYVLGETGADPSDAVMVGDRLHDVEGAAKFGIPTVGVLWGYGSREELERAGAKWLASDMDEMVDIIIKEA